MTRTKQTSLRILLPLTLISTYAQAGGFQLAEYSATGLGRAYSGEAAIADNAGSQWRNPALLTYLEGTQVSMGAVYIDPDVDVTASGTNTGVSYSNSTSDDYAGSATVPNFYASHQLSNDWAIGLAVSTNYGLSSDLGSSFLGSSFGDEGNLETIETNLNIGYKISEDVRIGAGARYVIAEGYFGSTYANSDTTFRYVEGDTTDWGWQAGITWQVNDQSRVGFTYKSEVNLDLEGTASGDLSGDYVPDGTYSAELPLTLPAMAELAYYYQINKDLMLSTSINWTDWSTFESLYVTTDEYGTTDLGEYNWKDNYRFSIGSEYKLDGQWTLRNGIAYDRSAVEDEDRTVVIPEVSRYWLTLGAGYKATEQLTIDASIAYIFSEDGSIYEENTDTATTMTATTEAHVFMTGIQISYAF